jgi:hypothetical protein
MDLNHKESRCEVDLAGSMYNRSGEGNALLRLPELARGSLSVRTKKKLHGLSPRANYTDLATAAYHRS